MAGNRKNALDDLAAGFLSTRPPAFDEFLQQQGTTLSPDIHQEEQRANGDTERAELMSSQTICSSKTQSIFSTNRTGPVMDKPKMLISSYEVLFLAKSDKYPSDPKNQRIYLRKPHARKLNRLVQYCKYQGQRMSVQAIVDNILQHHFEQFADDIKQIDQALLNVLQQQINGL